MKRGVVPFVSQVGALPELCGSQGLVVPGTAGERQFLVSLVNAVLRANGHSLDEADVLARFGMDVIVSRWIQRLNEYKEGRAPTARLRTWRVLGVGTLVLTPRPGL